MWPSLLSHPKEEGSNSTAPEPSHPRTKGSSSSNSLVSSGVEDRALRLKGGPAADLAKESTRSSQPKDTLTNLSDQINDLIRKNEVSSRAIIDMDKKITNASRLLDEAQRAQKEQNGSVNEKGKTDKRLRTMEDKLANKTQALCMEKEESRTLKEKINTIRECNLKSKSQIQKMSKEVKIWKKKTAEKTESAKKAEKRKQELEEQKALEELKRESDKIGHAKVLQHTESAILETRNFKCDPVIDTSQTRRGTYLLDSERRGNLNTMQEEELRSGIVKSRWASARKLITLDTEAKGLMSDHEAFSLIQKETGIESIDQFVQEFSAAEDRIISVASHIDTVLRPELALLKEDLEKTIMELDKFEVGVRSRIPNIEIAQFHFLLPKSCRQMDAALRNKNICLHRLKKT
jgi:hypothetical protein